MTNEEKAYKMTEAFVRELFKALDLDQDIEADQLEKEIDATTTEVVNRIDDRLREKFGDLF